MIGGNFYSVKDEGYLRADDGRLWAWTLNRVLGATWWTFLNQPYADMPGPAPSSAEYEQAMRGRYGPPRACDGFEKTLAEGLKTTSYATIWRLEVGWPARAFVLVHAEQSKSVHHVGGWKTFRGTDLQGDDMPEWAYPRGVPGGIGRSLLPTSPAWGGLIVDWVFWTLVVFAVPWLRRWRRHRRGRCADCGYDLRGATGPVCPECGARVRAARAVGGVDQDLLTTGRGR